MNYRHAYHAGNFADVFKHALLTRILSYLMRKETPLRYLETHGGIGLYDLSSEEAQKTGEWRDGIGRLQQAKLGAEIGELLAPYLALTQQFDGRYPGSPIIAKSMLRAQDRLTICELHPHDERRLVKNMGRDQRVKVLAMDGYQGLKAGVPPIERRGLVLIDPPFEARDEFATLARSVAQAHSKWATGCFAIWYPLKATPDVEAFRELMSKGDIRRVLCLELQIDNLQSEGALKGCGLIIINPPFALEAEAKQLLPVLTSVLSQGKGAAWRVNWLAGE
jgi:23S rRNA (adenine2030-N6)-methyltransferase